MARLLRRRTLLGLAGLGAALTAPALRGWRLLLGGEPAAGEEQIPPEEDLGYQGIIVEVPVIAVHGPNRIVIGTRRGDVEVVIPESAELVWAGKYQHYLPRVGDRVDVNGEWQGEPWRSTLVARRIYFNLERIRGVLETDAEVEGGVVRFTVYSEQQGRWRVRVEPEPLTYAVVWSSREGQLPLEGMEAMRAAKKGWGIDMIGFRERDGTLLVTWAELGVPEGAGDGR